MEEEFGPIRKSERQVGAGSILQGNNDPEDIPRFDIYPVSKKRKSGSSVREFPFAVINYPCLNNTNNSANNNNLFYEQLEFKKFRYYLLDSVVSKLIDYLPGLNRISEVVFKLVVRAMDKLEVQDPVQAARHFQLLVPPTEKYSSQFIDKPIVVLDTVCSSKYNLLILKLPDPHRLDSSLLDDLVRVLQYTYPKILELCKDKNINDIESVLKIVDELNSNRTSNKKQICVNIVLLKPDDQLTLASNSSSINRKIVILSTVTKTDEANDSKTINITSLGKFDITKLFLDISLLETRQGVSPQLIQRWNNLIRLQVPNSNDKDCLAGALFHGFLLSYTIGGLGYNFIYYMENVLNEARDINTLFDKLCLLKKGQNDTSSNNVGEQEGKWMLTKEKTTN